MTAPGAVPVEARAPAPDVARGAMLLLIALANVHLYLYGRPLGVRLYPADPTGADAWVTALQLTLVDGRAYPLFGALFGYGIGQLAARRAAIGATATEVTALVRRRGLCLFGIGAAHAVLLWPGDIVSAYGALAVVFAGLLVAGTVVSLVTTMVIGGLLGAFIGMFSGFSPGGTAPVSSIAIENPVAAMTDRLAEWGGNVLIGSLVSVVAAVAFGAWAARYRVLDEPGRHRRLLVRVAAAGLGAAVLGGLPLALAGAGAWAPDTGAMLLVGALHAVSGYAGGLGYAAAFGLLVGRRGPGAAPGLRRRTALSSEPMRRECRSSAADGTGARPDEARTGPVLRALAACGQRSLSCYLGQSVLFVVLLPAWTLGWGARLGVAQAALLAVAVWLVLLLVAVASARVGHRGPAELLLRRLTYGRAAARR